MTKIKDCPFCRGESKMRCVPDISPRDGRRTGERRYFVECTRCHAKTLEMPTNMAIKDHSNMNDYTNLDDHWKGIKPDNVVQEKLIEVWNNQGIRGERYSGIHKGNRTSLYKSVASPKRKSVMASCKKRAYKKNHCADMGMLSANGISYAV